MSRRTGAAVALAAAALVAALVPEGAWAHGFVGREDLPIPRVVFAWAATAVLVISFVGLAALWQSPRLEGAERRERSLLRAPLVLEILAGAIGVALFAIVVWAGFAGTQSTSANLAPTLVCVVFWTGIPVVSLLLGDVFAPFNPWRAVGRAAGWVARRVRGDALPEVLPYPARLGRWPAAAGLLGFAVFELVIGGCEDPSHIAVGALLYAAVQLVGMSLYGVEPWTRNADGFAVLFRLFGAISPLHWHERRLSVRPLLSGLTRLEPLPGTVAVLVVAIATTTFDGASEGPLWTDAALWIQERLLDVGLSAATALDVAYAIGLALAVVLVAGLYKLGIRGMQTVDRTHTRAETRWGAGGTSSGAPIAPSTTPC